VVLKPPFGDPHFLSRSVGGSETSASASDRVALSFATISSDPALLDRAIREGGSTEPALQRKRQR
jgi:hypothetical protein